MTASRLDDARAALRNFESQITTAEGIRYLAEGLDLLDEIVLEEKGSSDIAKNIGDAYAEKVMDYVEGPLDSGPATEPEAEQFIMLLTELRPYEFGSKERLKSLTSKVYRVLFQNYYRGYSEEEKKEEIRRLRNASDT